MSTFVPTTKSYREGARTLPRDHFVSPALFDAERERIFQRHWVCVGRESELPQAGAYRLVTVAGESLILVRAGDGSLRAFFNVCRHRGTRLCEQERGVLGSSIQCPYHAWTYGLDGRLLGAPHMRDVAGFDPSRHGLHAAAVQRWHGFVFVAVEEPEEPLAALMAPLARHAVARNVAALRSVARIEYDVRANWKLIAENYSECAHCPVIHPELTRLSPYDSGENDLVEGPILGGYMTLRAGEESMTLSGHAAGSPLGDLPHEELSRVYYYSVFPSLLLSLHPDYVMAHTLWPESPERTRVVCEWLFAPDSGDGAARDPAGAVAFWDMTNRQDWRVCELSQLGVASRRYTPGPYSPRESIPAAWDAEYLRRLDL